MRRLSGARSVAIGVVGVALGWWISIDKASKLAHYKGMSPDGLAGELVSKYDAKLTSTILGALITVVIIVGAVDLVTALIERLSARFGSSPGAPKPSSDTPA